MALSEWWGGGDDSHALPKTRFALLVDGASLLVSAVEQVLKEEIWAEHVGTAEAAAPGGLALLLTALSLGHVVLPARIGTRDSSGQRGVGISGQTSIANQLPSKRLETLTPAQQGVLDLMAKGWTNGRIGREMKVSTATVKTHVHHILQKLGVDRRTGAVALYMMMRPEESPVSDPLAEARPDRRSTSNG